MNATHEIRTLFAPIQGSGVLLPGSVVAEVVEFSEPKPFRDTPDWLLGEIEWNGWQIPVVNYAILADSGDDNTISPRNRILVVKTLSNSTSVAHVGLVINGLPQLKKISTGSLVENNTKSSTGIFSHVTIDGQAAVIPDLDGLATAIEQAAYKSL